MIVKALLGTPFGAFIEPQFLYSGNNRPLGILTSVVVGQTTAAGDDFISRAIFYRLVQMDRIAYTAIVEPEVEVDTRSGIVRLRHSEMN